MKVMHDRKPRMVHSVNSAWMMGFISLEAFAKMASLAFSKTMVMRMRAVRMEKTHVATTAGSCPWPCSASVMAVAVGGGSWELGLAVSAVSRPRAEGRRFATSGATTPEPSSRTRRTAPLRTWRTLRTWRFSSLAVASDAGAWDAGNRRVSVCGALPGRLRATYSQPSLATSFFWFRERPDQVSCKFQGRKRPKTPGATLEADAAAETPGGRGTPAVVINRPLWAHRCGVGAGDRLEWHDRPATCEALSRKRTTRLGLVPARGGWKWVYRAVDLDLEVKASARRANLGPA